MTFNYKQCLAEMKAMSYMTQSSIATHQHDGSGIKIQARTMFISMLLLNVLNIVGNVDCYNGWSNPGSQPKEWFKQLWKIIFGGKNFIFKVHNFLCGKLVHWVHYLCIKSEMFESNFRSLLTMYMDLWLIQ